MQILHIIKDEKFIDSAYAAFENAAPGQNDYVVLGEERALKYISTFSPRFSGRKPYLRKVFIDEVNKCRAVVVHGLTRGACEIISRLGPGVKVLWIGMGYDYYDLIYNDDSALFKPMTRSFYQKEQKKSIYKALKALVYKKLFNVGVSKTDVMSRINYFAPVLSSEFSKVKCLSSNFSFEFLDWNYGVISSLVDGDVGCQEVSGNNIIVGNSATPTNNHVDAFDLIDRKYLDGRIVYCPLSYGDSKYASAIREYGASLYGKSFVGLDSFMLFDEYVRLLSSCSFVIMNHVRQQAGANILMSVYLGSRVFVDKRNPFYDYLAEKGVVFNSVDDLKNDSNLINVPLTESDKRINKSLIKKDWSWEAIDYKTKNVLSSLLG